MVFESGNLYEKDGTYLLGWKVHKPGVKVRVICGIKFQVQTNSFVWISHVRPRARLMWTARTVPIINLDVVTKNRVYKSYQIPKIYWENETGFRFSTFHAVVVKFISTISYFEFHEACGLEPWDHISFVAMCDWLEKYTRIRLPAPARCRTYS